MRARSLVVPAVLAVVLGVASPAQAAITVNGSFIQGDGADDIIGVGCVAGVLNASGVTGAPCAEVVNLVVMPGNGRDTLDLTGVTTAAFPALASVRVDVDEAAGIIAPDVVTGSPGEDLLTGDGTDVLSGGDGDDAITGGGSVNGGLGDDTIVEFRGGSITPTGGPGDDRFVQFLAAGGVEGGPGFDTYEMDLDRAGGGFGAALAIRAAADTLALVAGPTSVVIPIGGIESLDFALLRAGSQTWDGAAFAGFQRVRGLGGADILSGGASDDQLLGGSGDDAITGGGGSDHLAGGDGNDTIQARDGVADRVDCGAGADAVVADAADAVVGCEAVELPAVPPPPAVAPVTGAVSGPAKVRKPKKATFRFTSATAGVTFQCRVDGKAYRTCSSPFKVATKRLKAGKHKVSVRAVLAGVPDASPSVRSFKVKARQAGR